jgi:hypothetical protein
MDAFWIGFEKRAISAGAWVKAIKKRKDSAPMGIHIEGRPLLPKKEVNKEITKIKKELSPKDRIMHAHLSDNFRPIVDTTRTYKYRYKGSRYNKDTRPARIKKQMDAYDARNAAELKRHQEAKLAPKKRKHAWNRFEKSK